jgi:SAM-dependent methyltransferase
MEQRFIFDQVAGTYAAARPDYPETLADDVLSFAELQPGDRILEIGCGSGQATKSFARRGFAILAIDPGAALIRAAREHLAEFAKVELLETTFESWPEREAAFQPRHRRPSLALDLSRAAFCQSCASPVGRGFAGRIRQCACGIARRLARRFPADLSAPDRSLGSSAGGLVISPAVPSKPNSSGPGYSLR